MTIIDDNVNILKNSYGLETDNEYLLCALWALGTYFLKHAPDMKAARQFGMLGFIAPEEDSGKSTALDAVSLLSYKPWKRGKKTTAAILDKISDMDDKNTVPLDELHKKLGKDDDFDDLFNLGYEWNVTIERKNRHDSGQKEISAYFPKVFAAMSENTIQSDTASRCIIMHMYPRTEYQDGLDYAALKKENDLNLEWSERQETIKALTEVELPEKDLSFLLNRKRQILKLMLSIAKITDEQTYQATLEACRAFVESEDRERGMNHKVLLALYRIKELKLYEKKFFNKDEWIASGDEHYIWTTPMMTLLHENGIPDYIKETTVSKFFKGYDIRIKPMQIRIGIHNLNGYRYNMFDRAFRYITQKEKDEINAEAKELGLVGMVDTADKLGTADRLGTIGALDDTDAHKGKGTGFVSVSARGTLNYL